MDKILKNLESEAKVREEVNAKKWLGPLSRPLGCAACLANELNLACRLYTGHWEDELAQPPCSQLAGSSQQPKCYSR